MEAKLSASDKLEVVERLLSEVMAEKPNYSTAAQLVHDVRRLKTLIDANRPEQIAPVRPYKGRKK